MNNINLNVLQTCSSTNDIAFKDAMNGKGEGTSYLAHTQTKGRGRNQNNWESMDGNLFISTILKQKKNKCYWHQLSLIVGYSILEVLFNLGVKRNIIELKWPNDVLVDNKKISGVLLESSNDFIIVGIGLNILKNPTLEIKWDTTKLIDHVKGNLPKEEIAFKMLKKVYDNYFLWEKSGFNFFLNIINKNIKNIDKNVVIKLTSKSDPINGVFLGLGENGGFKIKTDTNITEHYSIESFSFE